MDIKNFSNLFILFVIAVALYFLYNYIYMKIGDFYIEKENFKNEILKELNDLKTKVSKLEKGISNETNSLKETKDEKKDNLEFLFSNMSSEKRDEKSILSSEGDNKSNNSTYSKKSSSSNKDESSSQHDIPLTKEKIRI